MVESVLIFISNVLFVLCDLRPCDTFKVIHVAIVSILNIWQKSLKYKENWKYKRIMDEEKQQKSFLIG